MIRSRNLLVTSGALAALCWVGGAGALPAYGAEMPGKELSLTQEHGEGHGQDRRRGGSGSQRDAEIRGQSGRSLHGLFRDITGLDDENDSDRPDWAGTPGGGSDHGGGRPAGAGSQRGDLYGDLWVILRDEDGVPILTPEGWVQPLDADGELIPLDEEGQPIDESLVQEVELGRLNVGRAPSSVLDRRAQEVITLLNDATALSTDAAGRLVITTPDGTSTIDSPLENLAIYVALLTQGGIPGVGDLPGDEFDHLVDGAFTTEDLAASVGFLAAATDKSSAFTADEIAYINAFLDVNTVTNGSVTWSAVDYSTFTYDRSDSFSGLEVAVLVEQADGSWAVQTVSVFEAVFSGEDASASGTLDAYTLAADDARAVVNFLHEYEVPLPSSYTGAP